MPIVLGLTSITQLWCCCCREVLILLRNSSNPQAEFIIRVIKKWVKDTGAVVDVNV